MLLAIDVGNTETVVGLFSLGPGDDPPASSRPAPPAPPEPAGLCAPLAAVDGGQPHTRRARPVALGAAHPGRHGRSPMSSRAWRSRSSVPRVTTALRQMASRWFDVPCVVLGPGVRSGMPILYDNPKEVGADRIANAIGAYDLYGGPCIVVDLGTATTFDAISTEGEYLGGAIAPGIAISMDALFHHAAALPRVELVEPRSVIGKSTVESIQSGALYGYAAQVDGMCRRITDELGPATVVATGGLSEIIAPLSPGDRPPRALAHVARAAARLRAQRQGGVRRDH